MADVSLQLHCEGTEIIAQLKPDQAFTDASSSLSLIEGAELGKITVQPANWRTEYEFLLRLKITAESSAAQSSMQTCLATSNTATQRAFYYFTFWNLKKSNSS